MSPSSPPGDHGGLGKRRNVSRGAHFCQSFAKLAKNLVLRLLLENKFRKNRQGNRPKTVLRKLKALGAWSECTRMRRVSQSTHSASYIPCGKGLFHFSIFFPFCRTTYCVAVALVRRRRVSAGLCGGGVVPHTPCRERYCAVYVNSSWALAHVCERGHGRSIVCVSGIRRE